MARSVQQRAADVQPTSKSVSVSNRYDKDSFWDANDVLKKTYAAAASRGVGRWALLVNNLARVSMLIPPSAVLPPIVGSSASLNFFAATAAASGGGKSASESVAHEMVWINDTPVLRPSTGQGLTASYVKYVAARPGNEKDGREPEPAHLERIEWRALFSVDEIGSLEARAGSGNSLMPDLRSAWMGKALGSATVTKENRLSVTDHSYRLGLVVGTQLGAAGFLLNDSDVGTPQRFVFVPGQDDNGLSDEDIDNMTLEELAMSGETVERIDMNHLPPLDYNRDLETWEPDEFTPVSVCDAAKLEVLRDNRRTVKRFPPHHLLCRLKTACLLSFYCGDNGDVTNEYWELAGVVMQVSEETKQMLREHADRVEAQENERLAVKRGDAEIVKLDRMAQRRDEQRERAGTRLLELLKDEPLTHRQVGQKFNSRTRGAAYEVLTDLIEEGRVILAGELYALNNDYKEDE
jgi:hypothetical protein